VKEEDKQNVELIDLSKQILTLTKEVRSFSAPSDAADRSPDSGRPGQ
jgi:hypothetical protein